MVGHTVRSAVGSTVNKSAIGCTVRRSVVEAQYKGQQSNVEVSGQTEMTRITSYFRFRWSSFPGGGGATILLECQVFLPLRSRTAKMYTWPSFPSLWKQKGEEPTDMAAEKPDHRCGQ